MKIKRTALVLTSLLLLAPVNLIHAAMTGQQTKLMIETRILDFDPVAGMKSTQTIQVDFVKQTVISSYVTGNTYGIPSTRDSFVVEQIKFSPDQNQVNFKVIGATASGVQIMPNIDYQFNFTLSSDNQLSINGCHDAYPAYKVILNGKSEYEFKHERKDLIKLFGECDIKVQQ